jgi:hypothetical protein
LTAQFALIFGRKAGDKALVTGTFHKLIIRGAVSVPIYENLDGLDAVVVIGKISAGILRCR